MAKRKRIPKHKEMSFNRSLLLNPNAGWLPVNRANWSEKSQGSWSFMEVYTDDIYRCRYCGNQAVFTAQEQKYEYEVKKRYIDQKRVLCKPCFHDMHAKREAIKAIESRWQSEKHQLQNDIAFLHDWLEHLTDYQRYTRKANNTIASLKRSIIKLQEK